MNANNAVDKSMYHKPAAMGLVLTSPGGAVGWWARRVLPRLSTRIYLAYIRASRAAATRRRIASFLDQPVAPLFSHVEIETINKCNGECAFCPVNRNQDPRPSARMSEQLFTSIIDQLAALNYDGHLGLFSNNEPLLDTRLSALAAQAREQLPNAYIALSTNGSLLDSEKLVALLPSFDRIIINNYSDSPALEPHLESIRASLSRPEAAHLLDGKTVEFCLRGKNDVLTSRAGSAPNRANPPEPLRLPCSLPFSQLIIRPDGKVSLCCNDALGRVTLGDVSQTSLLDVWRGQPAAAVRASMMTHGRAGHPLCKACDFVKHDVN